MNNTCCFFGHREIEITPKLKEKIYNSVKQLIINEKINTFLFGSNSQFDNLCYNTVTNLKTEFPFIKRVYVRAEYPHITEHYNSYLLKYYESTYFPDHILNAGKAIYIERNYEMIEKSKFCIIYFDKNTNTKSGTKIAYNYALKKQKVIINMC